MIDLRKYRIIDLSPEIVPGERKIDGRYLHGQPRAGRPVEVQEYIAYGARMHTIQGHTHCGTHVEAFYKYRDDEKDMAAMPIETYIGEAVACDLTSKAAGAAITSEDFQKAGVERGNIVLAWGNSAYADCSPYLSVDAVDWLISTGIKLLAIEYIDSSSPDLPSGKPIADCRLSLAGIPIADDVVGLSQITKPRVFFIALPLKMRRVTASWARAIVLEEI